MKKAIKIFIVLLVIAWFVIPVVFFLCIYFRLSNYVFQPYYLDTWYLESYIEEDGETHNIGCDAIKQEMLYSDDITIQYFEDNTFIFKEFDKEYSGTYTAYKDDDVRGTAIALTFSDGTKGNGTCARYILDRVPYDATLQVFGKKYIFSDNFEEENMGERDLSPYTHVGGNIATMLKKTNTEMSAYYRGQSYTLHKGKIERRGEEYWFVPDNEQTIEKNLSQAVEVYSYEVAEDFSVQRGDNVLRESLCFINYNEYSVQLDSENTETRSKYAVWYYQDAFSKVFPDLDKEEILSVRSEEWCAYLSLYSVEIFEQGSFGWEEFCNWFLSQSIILENPASEIDFETTYYIKTCEQTYTFVLQTRYSGGRPYQGLVVNGKFYRICGDELFFHTPSGYFYAFSEDAEVKLFIDNEYVKSYDNLIENLLFKVKASATETSSEYMLKVGEKTLILLDEKHFIYQYLNNDEYFEIIGDVDFSEIFEENPLTDES